MSELLKTGAVWLTGQMKSKAGTAVTYRRGSETVSVTATVGTTTWDQDDGTGGVVQWQSRDYLIDTADLVLSGVTTEPQLGDRIEETVGGVKHTYEVLGEAGQPQARYMDPYRQKWRIHTKQVRLPQ